MNVAMSRRISGPNARTSVLLRNRCMNLRIFAPPGPRPRAASAATAFLATLRIPEGPSAGKLLKLAPFQRKFIKGALRQDTSVAALSVGRGGAKSALAAALALGALLGVWDLQPRREVLLAARTRDQARIAWEYAAAFSRSLPVELQARLIFRRSPRLEIEYEGDGGHHYLRALAADAKARSARRAAAPRRPGCGRTRPRRLGQHDGRRRLLARDGPPRCVGPSRARLHCSPAARPMASPAAMSRWPTGPSLLFSGMRRCRWRHGWRR